MKLQEERNTFEQKKKIYESSKLTFLGVDGMDVYNTSVPFVMNNKEYIFGRIENRNEWARSWVQLFHKKSDDVWELEENSMIYQLEDPFVAKIGGELVLGGTHVRKKYGETETYYCYFYRGTDINNMYYFTTGPDFMKDIRLVQLADGKIGVFSRPRSDKTLEKYGTESVIGYTTINSLDELDDKVIESAKIIDGFLNEGEWGGCNQCYALENGKIGVIGHKCYKANSELDVYLNVAFIFDPETYSISDLKVIGTRSCYPDGPTKIVRTGDTAFTSGIVMRDDGKADLYSGLGDVEEGRAVIDYPFGEEKIINPNIIINE